MALSDAQLKALVLSDLGKTGDVTYTALVETWWELHAAKAARSSYLRFLYTKRQAIERMMADVSGQFDWHEADVSESHSQKMKNLTEMRQAVDAEIGQVQKAGAIPRVSQITTTAPVTVTTEPDPNSRRYRGDPILR